jgi:3-oxoacyl-[acyl-carrier protein] reductase
MTDDASQVAGKVAFVTGASTGIGRACARLLDGHGAAVAIGFHEDEKAAHESASECRDAHVVRLDVRCKDEVTRAIDEIERVLGPVQILVNSAGVNRDRLLVMMRDKDWDEVVDTDLSGVFRCTRRALRSMLRLHWGRIVSLGSVSGSLGAPGQANYAAAKAGIVGFTRAVAREVARYGITANTVSPGLVDTDMTAELDEKVRAKLLELVAMGRMAKPEEIAEAVWFCVASPYMTGQNLVIDGGLS